MVPFPQAVRFTLEAKSRSLLARLRHFELPRIEQRRAQYSSRSDSELQQIIRSLKLRVAAGEKSRELDSIFIASVAEVCRRTVGIQLFESQILAALLLTRNKVIQMNTGEGKTFVAPFAAINSVMRGERALVVTANQYLSSRDAEWMRPIYDFFEIECGALHSAMSMTDRCVEYGKPVAYVSGDQLIFDYLRKEHATRTDHDLPITRAFVIIDEIDTVLIDYGSRSFQLVDSVSFSSEMFAWADEMERKFVLNEHFTVLGSGSSLVLTSEGRSLLVQETEQLGEEDRLGAEFYLRCALKAHHLYIQGVDYLIQGKRLIIVNSITGLPDPANSFSFGLQQAIEQKEGLLLSHPNSVLNEITVQSFYRGFANKCGMSGSALHNALEFTVFYKLDVVPLDPHHACIRTDQTDTVYRTRREQVKATVQDTKAAHAIGRPVLIGTQSVRDAEIVSEALALENLPHKLLTARNYQEEATIIEEAGNSGQITIAAKLAGRGVDIKLSNAARVAGGLHVIGFGRANERRLDEQLSGRSGRQGDPGSSHFIISLEDDLMRYFTGEWVSKLLRKLGMQEDVPIESEMIGRRILSAQRNVMLQSFSSRNWFILLDECTREVRASLFDLREQIMSAFQLEPDITLLLHRHAKRVLYAVKDLGKALEVYEKIADTLKVQLSAAVYTATALTTIDEAFRDSLLASFKLKCTDVGTDALLRERPIFLRTIDVVWAEFLNEFRRKTEDMTFGEPTASSRVASISNLMSLSSGQRERVLEILDARLVQNLFRIDDEPYLVKLGVWDDGFQSGQLITQAVAAATETLEELFVKEPGQIRPEASLRDYLIAYRNEIDSFEANAERLQNVHDVFVRFGQFLVSNRFEVSEVRAASHSFLYRNVFVLNRRFERKALEGFLEHLVRQGLVVPPPLTSEPLLVNRMHIVAGQFSQPVLLMKSVGLLLMILVYPAILLRHVTALSARLSYPHFWFVPYTLERMYDLIYLGSSWEHATLGLLGVTPILSAGMILRIAQRRGGETNLILTAPIAFLLSAVVVGLLAHLGFGGSTPSLWFMSRLFSEIFVATLIILLLIHIVSLLEVIDGVSLAIAINLTIVLAAFLLRLWSSAHLRWSFLGGTASALLVTSLIERYSSMAVPVLTTGALDVQAARLQTRKADLRVRTVFGYQHLLAAVIAVSYSNALLRRAEWVHGRALIILGDLLSCGLAMFLVLTISKNVRLSASNIRYFLEGRDATLPGGPDGMNALQQRFGRETILNSLFRTGLLAGLIGWSFSLTSITT